MKRVKRKRRRDVERIKELEQENQKLRQALAPIVPQILEGRVEELRGGPGFNVALDWIQASQILGVSEQAIIDHGAKLLSKKKEPVVENVGKHLPLISPPFFPKYQGPNVVDAVKESIRDTLQSHIGMPVTEQMKQSVVHAIESQLSTIIREAGLPAHAGAKVAVHDDFGNVKFSVTPILEPEDPSYDRLIKLLLEAVP